MEIEWAETALDDLEALRDYIGQDSPYYARRFIERIFLAVQALNVHPLAGRRVPEAAREDVRELIYFGYRIIYRVRHDRVSVITVVHGGRNLPAMENKPWHEE